MDQQGLHLLGYGLLRPIGGCNELVQATQFDKPTQIAETAVVGLDEDEMGSRQETFQEIQPMRCLEEPSHVMGPRTPPHYRSLPPDPITQSPRRHTEFSGNLGTAHPGGVEFLEPGHFLRRLPARLPPSFSWAVPICTIERGIHGLGLLQWLIPTTTTIEKPKPGCLVKKLALPALSKLTIKAETVAVWSAIVPRGYVDGVCDLSARQLP